METLYLESTIPSYFTSELSRDIIILAHQQITREWWDNYLPNYDIYISELVIEEISAGDANAVLKRNQAISNFQILSINKDIETLTGIYVKNISILKEAPRDALHLAIASTHHMDYLVTWN